MCYWEHVFSICLPCAGLSHQQVVVCQRHPALQTDGGEVKIWQPVAPLTPGIKTTLESREGGGGGRQTEAWNNLSVPDRGETEPARPPCMDGLRADCYTYHCLLHIKPSRLHQWYIGGWQGKNLMSPICLFHKTYCSYFNDKRWLQQRLRPYVSSLFIKVV